MKPKFRLHVHNSPLCLETVHHNVIVKNWTCSVRFVTPSTEVLMNSGPCTIPRNAIAEAALLMRRATGHAYR